jgi:hypothetical protein
MRITKKDKDHLWDLMTTNVNSAGVTKRSRNYIKKKFKNMKQKFKASYTAAKQHAKKTGGGSPLVQTPNETSLGEIFEDDPAFTGIGAGGECGLSDCSDEEPPISETHMVPETPLGAVTPQAKNAESKSRKKPGPKKDMSQLVLEKQLRVLEMQETVANLQITYYRQLLAPPVQSQDPPRKCFPTCVC